MTELEYTQLAQILGNQDRVREWMIANQELVNGRRSKVPLPELPPVNPAQSAVGQPQITLPPREPALAARVEQSEVGQPEAEESLSVNPSPPPPSSLSVRGPEDQSAYAKNTATLAALRSDPLGYMSGMRAEQLGLVDKRIADLTDPTDAGYRNRSQANWFNLAAQLMKPTMSGSLVENLGGAFGYLGSEAAKRQDLLAALQEKRAELAQKYDIAMLNAQSAASKPDDLKNIVMGDDFIPRDPISGQPIEAPSPIAYKALEDNPTDENLKNFLLNFPRFKQEAVRAITRGRMKRGTM